VVGREEHDAQAVRLLHELIRKFGTGHLPFQDLPGYYAIVRADQRPPDPQPLPGAERCSKGSRRVRGDPPTK
jgi:hypothetical protein